MSQVKLMKGSDVVTVKADKDGSYPVEYYNYVRAGWKVVKKPEKPESQIKKS